MNQNELRDKIIAANKAYRLGRPIMTDQDFDDLCEQYEAIVTAEEYADFRDSLHEETGKVKHPYIMGSLDKLKSDEPEDVIKWLNESIGLNNQISISAKVDGISCRLHYDMHGCFISATTRGDGEYGIDCTSKVLLIGNGVPQTINVAGEMDIRGELVITDDEFKSISDQFANPRNACAGLMNQKTPNPDLLKHVSFLAYEIMGGKIEKATQFTLLENLGFTTPWHSEPTLVQINEGLVDCLTKLAAYPRSYPTDGLVISAVNYKAEDRYRPVNQKAFKINQHGCATEIIGVEWGEPSKDGKIVPVALIDPVELAGSTISRVTLNNVDWIKQMNIGINSVVQIIKSGDVIPKITKIISNDGSTPIELPTVCPVCGTPVILDGCDVRCPNEDCPSRGYERVLAFITNMGIKRVSRRSLEAWGISDFTKLLQFSSSSGYKMQDYFVTEIENRVFHASEEDLFKALPFKDLAEITLTKIVNHYGYANLKSGTADLSTFPEGVGEKTMNAFFAYAQKNFDIVDMITSDPRYVKPAVVASIAPISASKGSVCFTGALNTMTRSEASKKAVAAGFEVKTTVGKGLTYLITNDPNSGSSKNKKAQQFGTKIITEEEFLAIL